MATLDSTPTVDQLKFKYNQVLADYRKAREAHDEPATRALYASYVKAKANLDNAMLKK